MLKEPPNLPPCLWLHPDQPILPTLLEHQSLEACVLLQTLEERCSIKTQQAACVILQLLIAHVKKAKKKQVILSLIIHFLKPMYPKI